MHSIVSGVDGVDVEASSNLGLDIGIVDLAIDRSCAAVAQNTV